MENLIDPIRFLQTQQTINQITGFLTPQQREDVLAYLRYTYAEEIKNGLCGKLGFETP